MPVPMPMPNHKRIVAGCGVRPPYWYNPGMNKLTYMIIGAHPDDADIDSGGVAILLKQHGHDVVFVSLTDGSAGHQTMGRKELAERRYAETQKVAEFLGITYVVMDSPDGELIADLTTRHKLIKVIREHRPDVIISPRPNDYHPDHRATGQLVQDCAFMLTVPAVCSEVQRLERNPYIFYGQDHFTKPAPFIPDVLIDITPVIDKKMESLSNHESQVFEWLPFIYPIAEPVPEARDEKLEFVKRHWGYPGGSERFVSLFNDPAVKFAEGLEHCEYGSKVTREVAQKLFPFAKINFTE